MGESEGKQEGKRMRKWNTMSRNNLKIVCSCVKTGGEDVNAGQSN